jgi:zinc transport system permease protein
LWVSRTDLYVLTLLDLLILLIVFLLHKKFVAISFDEDQARLQGLPVARLYLLLLILIALSIVLLIQVVGVVLVMTLLTIPAAIANLFTASLASMIVLAIIISALLTSGGNVIAYYLDWPTGATIALLAGCAYAATLLYSSRRTARFLRESSDAS